MACAWSTKEVSISENSLLRNLCVPLRLCGKEPVNRRGAGGRRDYAEKKHTFELLQLFHRDRGCIRQAARQASLSESDGLGADGNLEAAGHSVAHRVAWS